MTHERQLPVTTELGHVTYSDTSRIKDAPNRNDLCSLAARESEHGSRSKPYQEPRSFTQNQDGSFAQAPGPAEVMRGYPLNSRPSPLLATT